MELTGRVVHSGSPTYTEARTDWDGLYSSYPSVIVFAEKTEDVVNAVTWARQNDVALRARSGRHHLEGWSNVTGGIVIDVSEMKSAQLDPASRTVTVAAGLTQQEAVDTLGKHGFAVATGGEGTVGLAGATLGGGFGLLTRNFGMACDNLIAAEVVVARGSDGAEAIKVDQRNNSDLLWALRGAGNGNFGIVTSFTYKMHPLNEVSFLEAKWNGFSDLQGVFAAWQRLAPTTDPRLSSVLDILPDGPDLLAVLQSGSPAEAEKLLAPVLSVGKPDVSVTPGSWGAVHEAPPGGSAFGHRDALFYAEQGAGWNGDAITPQAHAWVSEFSEALRPYVNGAYVNVPNSDMADWETAYWGDNYARLREIKAKYDPDLVFQYEQSIAPA